MSAALGKFTGNEIPAPAIEYRVSRPLWIPENYGFYFKRNSEPFGNARDPSIELPHLHASVRRHMAGSHDGSPAKGRQGGLLRSLRSLAQTLRGPPSSSGF